MGPKASVLDRLMMSSHDEGDCRIWHGAIAGRDYGGIVIAGRTVLVHRAMWEVYHGRVPDGLFVRHLCNNKLCIKIGHLDANTRSENEKDKHRTKRGESLFIQRDIQCIQMTLWLDYP